MHNQETRRIFFVVNPISGGKVKNDWEAAIREYFKGRKEEIELYLLNGKDDKSSIRRHIELCRPDCVVAVGGDGTVKMVAEIVKETPMQLGILPAGSANGMAKELDIPIDTTAALQVITEGEARKIDLIRINEEELCIHLSDLGLNAMLVKYFEKSPSRGMWGYGRALVRVLWEKQKMRVTLQTDEGELKRSAYMVAFANARKYGTGANINPDGDVADGIFEVVIVRKINLLEIIKSIFTDRSFHPKRIEVLTTRQLRLMTNRKAYFQIDGEYMGKVSQVQARILPRIIQVMVPRKEELAQDFKQ